jgi:hypothetical protein
MKAHRQGNSPLQHNHAVLNKSVTKKGADKASSKEMKKRNGTFDTIALLVKQLVKYRLCTLNSQTDLSSGNQLKLKWQSHSSFGRMAKD